LFVATDIGVEKLLISDLSRVGESPFLAQSGGQNNLLAGGTNRVFALDYSAFVGGGEGGLLAIATRDENTAGSISVVKLVGEELTFDQILSAKAADAAGLASGRVTALDWGFNFLDEIGYFRWQLLVSTLDGFTIVDDPNTDPTAPTLVSPVSGYKTIDDTPTLSANYIDEDDGDVGTTNFRVATGSAQNCLDDSNVVASGTSAETLTNNEVTVFTPESSIGSDGTYYWCAQNNDGLATSAWTSMGSVILDTATPDIVAIDAGPSSADRTSFASDTIFNHLETGADGQVSFSWTDPASTSDDEFYYSLVEDAEIQLDNLVGWWKLDEEPDGTSGEIADDSGYNNSGTSNGMTSTESTSGVIDSAITFDGENDYIEMDNYSVTGDITAIGWFKTNSSEADIVILAPSSGGGILADVGLDQGHFAWDKTGSAGYKETVNTYSDGSWHHFAVVTADDKIYIDGQDQSLQQATMYRSSTKFLIGCRYLGSYSRFFNGSIDDVKIWNTALTASEVQSEYIRGKALKLDDGLTGWWKLDESPSGTSGEIRDFSGNGNNGTTAGSMDSNDLVSGKLGSALDFDGTDDVVDIGSTSQTVKTVSCWIYADNDTRDIIDFDGGTHSIEVTSGTLTATGFGTPTIYVDGSESATIRTGGWHHISTTTDSGFTASNLQIGKETTFFDGKIDDFKIFDRALSAAEIETLYRTRVATTATLDDFPTNYPSDDSTDELPDDRSYFHIRPFSGAGTFGTERNFSLNYSGRAPTIDPDSIKIYKSDGETEVPEGMTLVGESEVQVKPEVTNFEATATTLTVFHNLTDTASDFVSTFTPTTEDADGLSHPACVSGTDFGDCTSKVWYEMSASGDYSSIAFNPTVVIDGLTDDNYKVRIIASNDSMPNILADYGESEATGWLTSHYSASGEAAFYTSAYLEGWLYSESAGWIKLRAGSPATTNCSTQPTQTATDYGVMHDGAGNLCGYGYSESVGWVSFKGTGYQVTIASDHSLAGYALSEVVGWISF